MSASHLVSKELVSKEKSLPVRNVIVTKQIPVSQAYTEQLKHYTSLLLGIYLTVVRCLLD